MGVGTKRIRRNLKYFWKTILPFYLFHDVKGIFMIDKRLQKLAYILINHSLKIKKNDLFLINGRRFGLTRLYHIPIK